MLLRCLSDEFVWISVCCYCRHRDPCNRKFGWLHGCTPWKKETKSGTTISFDYISKRFHSEINRRIVFNTSKVTNLSYGKLHPGANTVSHSHSHSHADSEFRDVKAKQQQKNTILIVFSNCLCKSITVAQNLISCWVEMLFRYAVRLQSPKWVFNLFRMKLSVEFVEQRGN